MDEINPDHYKGSDGLQVIDFIESWGMGYHAANIAKYTLRAHRKGGRRDLEKAAWYCQRIIDGRLQKSLVVKKKIGIPVAQVSPAFNLDVERELILYWLVQGLFGDDECISMCGDAIQTAIDSWGSAGGARGAA